MCNNISVNEAYVDGFCIDDNVMMMTFRSVIAMTMCNGHDGRDVI